MLHAPSSSEYSEWTCRCATVGVLIGEETIGVAADATRASRPLAPAICGVQNAADVALRLPGRAARGQRVRDLHGPRRVGARRRRCGRPRAAANATWAAMDELLDGLGRADRRRCAGARRRGSCRGRRRGSRWRRRVHRARATGASAEALPRVGRRRADAARARVQVRALRGAGGGAGGVGGRHRRGARAAAPAAVLHPAHLDAAALPLACVAPLARARRRSGGRRRGLPELPVVRAGTLVDAPVTSRVSRPSTSGGPTAAGSWRGARGWSRTSRRSTSPATSPAGGGPSGARSSSTGRPSPRPGGARGVGRRSTTTRGSPATPRWRSAGGASAARFPARVSSSRSSRSTSGWCDGPVNAVLSCAARAGRLEAARGGRPEHPGDGARRRARVLHRGADGRRGRRDRRALPRSGRSWTMVEPFSRIGPFGPWSVDTVLLDSSARSSEHRGCVVVVAPRAHRAAEGRLGAHLSFAVAPHPVRGPCADLA